MNSTKHATDTDTNEQATTTDTTRTQIDTNTKRQHRSVEETSHIPEASEVKRVLPSELITAEQHTNAVTEHAVLPTTGELTPRVQLTGTVTRIEVDTDANTSTGVYARVFIGTINSECTAATTNPDVVSDVQALHSEPDGDGVIPVEPTPVTVLGEPTPVYDDGSFETTVVAIEHVTPITANELTRGLLQTAVDTIDRADTVSIDDTGVGELAVHKANAKNVIAHLSSNT